MVRESQEKMLPILRQTLSKQLLPMTSCLHARNSSNKLGKQDAELYDRVYENPLVTNVLPTTLHTTKVLFANHKTADFKNVWLRDNCSCPKCMDSVTRQKLLDTPSLDINVKPNSLKVTECGNLLISWQENDGQEHVSTFGSGWLYRYAQSFIQETFESPSASLHPARAPLVLWDKTTIQRQLPEISYAEFMEGEEGLKAWLEMIHVFGIAILRGVPPVPGMVVDVVKRFAYVKETQYGVTFDVVNEPDPGAHPAFSGLYLHHHTDMNYREKSPGMQLLHCLKADDPKLTTAPEGMSFFVDGFLAAKWLKDNEPSAFHILTSTPVRFEIHNKGKHYSQLWPIICMNQDGDVTEIHYNNRTMGPLQAPSHIVVPFYHAYKLFSDKVRQVSAELRFQMVPGDLVAFNNRRILHGRTSFNPKKVSRHLVGCYVDIDEVVSVYNSLLNQNLEN